MAHQCNFYCHEGEHTRRVLTDPRCTAEDILRDLAPYYAQRGLAVTRAMPAREVEVSDWLRRFNWHPSHNPALPHNPSHTSPWVVFVTPQQED